MKFLGTVLYVDDVPAALAFYDQAFGFHTRHFDPQLQYGELDTGDTVLALASHELASSLTGGRYVRPDNGVPAAVEISFLTSDVRAAFDRAVKAGAKPVAEPTVMPWGWTIGFVRSIEGTLVGLCSAPA